MLCEIHVMKGYILALGFFLLPKAFQALTRALSGHKAHKLSLGCVQVYGLSDHYKYFSYNGSEVHLNLLKGLKEHKCMEKCQVWLTFTNCKL